MAAHQATHALKNEDDQVQGVRDILQQAIAHRGRQYSHQHTFSLRFKDDDTKADRDTQHFQAMLRMLDLPSAEEVILSSKMVAWDFRPVIDKLTKRLDVEDDRKLIVWHYAGHAKLNDEDDLCLIPSLNSKAFLNFNREFGIFWEPEVVFDKTDVVIILDCCFSAKAARGTIQEDRTVEIISAVGMAQKALGNPSDVARFRNRTFTARLADEVARMIGSPDKTSITFSELVAKMREISQPERLPEYALKLGGTSVRLSISKIKSQGVVPSSGKSHGHFKSSSSGSSDAENPMAIFKIHLGQADSSSDEVIKLVEWIHTLHPTIGLELTGVFRGRSTELIFHAPWILWKMLDGLHCFDLVCETFGRNKLSEIPSQKKIQSREQLENLRPPHMRHDHPDQKG